LVCLKGSLPLVAITDADVVVPPADIKLRKECQSTTKHSREPIHKFANKGERGGVLDGESIELPVVLDGSEIAVFLLDEEEGECISGFQGLDVAFWQVFVNEFLKSNIFSW
jgi:hypothetical protein